MSAVVHRTAQLRPGNPLFYTYDGTTRTSFSYSECREAVDHHRAWLTTQVAREIESHVAHTRRTCTSRTASTTKQQVRVRQQQQQQRQHHRIGSGAGGTDDSASAHAAHAVVEIVVAYLAANSPDYLLSVLACTVVDLDVDVGTTINARVRPALLNYRWTDEEISRALRVQEPNGASGPIAMTPTKHVTILLYGDQFEQIARKVVGTIQTDPVQNALNHFAVPLRLPSLLRGPEQLLRGLGQGQGRTANNGGGTGADDALILFTSGTSSSAGAKGVRLSHNSLTVQAMAKLCPPCSYDEQTNMVATTVPFFHVGGISSALAVIMAGGTLTFPPAAKPTSLRNNTHEARQSAPSISFQPNRILDSLESNQAPANTLVVVPAMVHSLVAAAAAAAKVYPNVRLLLVGGQSLSGPQLAQTRLVFPNARVVQTYACTEAGSSITFAQLYPLLGEYRPTSSWGVAADSAFRPHGDFVGYAPAHVEMKVVPVSKEDSMKIRGVSSSPPPSSLSSSSSLSNTNATISQLKSGIIATRGPHVMNGYWQRGNEALLHCAQNRIGLTADGWLLTNDLGHLDVKGRLYFSGRTSDVIRSGGESIPASEVERVVLLHPLIVACAVFPLPDERYGEAVCAAVVLKEHAGTARSRVVITKEHILAEIKRHCTKHGLAPYKRPKRAFIVPELPTNSSGKVLKHQLVDMFKATREEEKEGDDKTSLVPVPVPMLLSGRMKSRL